MPLIACNTVTSVNVHVYDPMSFLTYAAYNRDVEVITIGNPTSSPDDQLEALITDSLQENYRFLQTNFVAGPSDRILEPYKIVFIFNPRPDLLENEICENPAKAGTVTPPSGTEITAVFCEKMALTHISASFPSKPSLENGEFRHVINYLSWQLVPRGKEENQESCDPEETGC